MEGVHGGDAKKIAAVRLVPNHPLKWRVSMERVGSEGGGAGSTQPPSEMEGVHGVEEVFLDTHASSFIRRLNVALCGPGTGHILFNEEEYCLSFRERQSICSKTAVILLKSSFLKGLTN